MCRSGKPKEEVTKYLESAFGYDLNTPLDSIRSSYRYDATSKGTMPVALRAFLESTDWESAVRLAVSMGGDADTLACITGSIAEPFYGGVPDAIAASVRDLMLIQCPHLLEVTDEFVARFVEQ